MTTGLNRGSAKIYQFPVRVRSGLGGHREEAKSGENAQAPNPASRFANAAFGSAWYHEEAVQEAERTGKV
jgi:Protein of unknown function (DUF2735)